MRRAVRSLSVSGWEVDDDGVRERRVRRRLIARWWSLSLVGFKSIIYD